MSWNTTGSEYEENLVVDLIQRAVIERADRSLHLLLPLRVIGLNQIIRDDMGQHFQRLGLGEDLADLAHGHAAINPVDNAAHALDFGHRIQPVPAFGARRLDQTVAALPCTQRYRVDAGQPRHLPNREQLFALKCDRGLRGRVSVRDNSHGADVSAR